MTKTNNLNKRIIALVFMFIIFLGSLISNTTGTVRAVGENKMENSDVLADLRSDPAFDIKNYPFNSNGELTCISFNEYCYSFYENLKQNYGLYLYVYNPQCLDISDSTRNTIEMAVAYDEKGPCEYRKFQLKLCSVSNEPDYFRLFYKFKVIDRLVNGTTIYDRLNSNERRYDVSGFELVINGEYTAIDTGISKTYYFSGYSAGYGPNTNATESTLKYNVDTLETVQLNVHHTYWRSMSSSKGNNYQNQLDSVYFAVPNEFLEKYGKLQKITAEWYEYKTKDIVVTSNQDFYNAVMPYVGNYNEYNYFDHEVGSEEYNTKLDKAYSLLYGLADFDNKGTHVANWTWNTDPFKSLFLEYITQIPSSDPLAQARPEVIYWCQELLYLLHTKDWCDIKEYDPYAEVESTGGITGNDLYDYIKWYSNTFGVENDVEIKDGMLSSDLFRDTVDYGRTRGYNCLTFDADIDIQAWESWGDNTNFFNNWLNFGFWSAIFGNEQIKEEGKSLAPIITLTDAEVNNDLSDKQISDNLFVNFNDVTTLRNEFNKAKSEDKTLVLFRFAVTDYYSKEIDIIKYTGAGGPLGTISEQAYRAFETVFFDFDVISLGFLRNDVLTVIPCISNPIDIVNDITSPTIFGGGCSLGGILGILLFLLVLLVLQLTGILPLIIKGIWWLITSPYRFVRWVIARG